MVGLLCRSLTLAWKDPTRWLLPLLFYLIVVGIAPLGVRHHADMLPLLAPPILWLALLLASLLSLDQMFRDDFHDGSLEQCLLAPFGYSPLAFAHILFHWIVTCLPIVLLSPLCAMVFGMPSKLLPTLVLALFIGTPALSALGSIGAAMTVNIRRGGLILNILLLPLYIPLMIFGVGAVEMQAAGYSAAGALAFLGGMTIMLLLTAPFVITFILRCLLF